MATNILIILSDAHSRHMNALIGLDITAGIASALGILGLMVGLIFLVHWRSVLTKTTYIRTISKKNM